MRTALACSSVIVLAAISFGFGKQEATQEKPKENPPPAADAAKPAVTDRKNPVTPTPESLSAAKKCLGTIAPCVTAPRAMAKAIWSSP